MQGAPCNIIVFVKGKHWGFIGVTIVKGRVQNFINIPNKRRAPSDTVTVETDCLVVGSEPGTKKIANALQYNVKIIYEEEFIKLLKG